MSEKEIKRRERLINKLYRKYDVLWGRTNPRRLHKMWKKAKDMEYEIYG